MSRLRLLVALAGLLAVGWLVREIGPAEILGALERLSWRLPLLCLPFALVALLDTVGWRYAFPDRQPALGLLAVARVAGEAINVTTPTATVGGEAVKAWLLTKAGVPPDEGLVSVVVAKSTLMASQILFTGLALLLGASLLGVPRTLLAVLAAITAAGALALAGFVWVQQRELFGGGSRVLAWLGLGGRLARHAADVDRGLVRYYRHRRARCGLSILFHLLGWIAGSLEAWASLQLLGVPASLVTALVVEASVTAVRSATFFIPGSVGAQEGSLVGVVLALGLPPEVGLTLGIVRRLREGVWAALGYLVLVSWRRRSP